MREREREIGMKGGKDGGREGKLSANATQVLATRPIRPPKPSELKAALKPDVIKMRYCCDIDAIMM